MLQLDAAAATRRVVRRFLDLLDAGDVDGVAALFAPEVDFRLDWPERWLGGPIPWIRARHTPADMRAHFGAIAEHNAPHAGGTQVERVIVEDEEAVLMGVLRNVVRRTGMAYAARFALHLTIEDGLIARFHLYEDSLAVAEAWRGEAAGG